MTPPDPAPVKTLEQQLDEFWASSPRLDQTVFVAPGAVVLGKVSVGELSSIWFQTVIRADINEIAIGSRTNVQDGSILHVADDYPLRIGSEVTCGHRAIVHACVVADRVLIGMGAVIMDGARIESDCVIGAGALVTKGAAIPAGSLVLGSPGRVARPLTSREIAEIPRLAAKYVSVAERYRNK